MSYFLPRSDESFTRGEELLQGSNKMVVYSIVVRKFREGGELFQGNLKILVYSIVVRKSSERVRERVFAQAAP